MKKKSKKSKHHQARKPRKAPQPKPQEDYYTMSITVYEDAVDGLDRPLSEALEELKQELEEIDRAEESKPNTEKGEI